MIQKKKNRELLPKAEQKRRLWLFLRSVGGILLLGVIYYLIVELTGFSISCPIRLATGKLCPGCGISRMCMALLHLDLKGAFNCNRFLFVLLPFLLIYGIWKKYLYIRYDDQRMATWEMVVIILLFIAAVIYAILRNMDAFSYLQPM